MRKRARTLSARDQRLVEQELRASREFIRGLFGTSLPSELPFPSVPTMRYVDPVSGSNGDSGSSQAAAWATLQFAHTQLTAGMVVNVMGGADHGTSATTHGSGSTGRNGTITNPWVIQPCAGHGVVTIKGQLRFDDCDYGVVRGKVGSDSLYMEGPSPSTSEPQLRFNSGSQTIQIRDLEIDGQSGAFNGGVWLSGSCKGIWLARCYIHDVGTAPGNSTTHQGVYWSDASGYMTDCVMARIGAFGLQHYVDNENETFYASGCVAYDCNIGFLFNSGGNAGEAGPPAVAGIFNSIAMNTHGSNGSGFYTGPNSAFSLEVRNCMTFDCDGSDLEIGAITPTQSGNQWNVDPDFVDPVNHDFRLQITSPAIGAGANDGYVFPTDFDGVVRTEPVDVGAFTFVAGGGGGGTPGAYGFDGVDDKVQAAITAMDTGDWTLCAWVRPDSAGESDTGVLVRTENATALRQNLRFQDVTRTIRAAQSHATTEAASVSNQTLPTGAWSCVVATFRASDSKCRIWIGDEDTAMAEATYASQVAGAGARNTGGTDAILGATAAGAQVLDGKLAASGIFAREWTPTEIENFRQNGVPDSFTSARGFWELDDDELDTSGQGANGTATGAAADGPGPTFSGPEGIELVQSAEASTGDVDSLALNMPSLPAVGNLLVVGITTWLAGSGLAGCVTDNQGNTYAQAGATNTWSGTQARTAIFYTEVQASAGTFTVTVNPPSDPSASITFWVAEFSGITDPVLDQATQALGSSASPSSGNITTTAADEVIVGIVSHDNGTETITVTGGATIVQEEESGTVMPGAMSYRVVAATGTYAATWTLGSSLPWSAHVASFKSFASSVNVALVSLPRPLHLRPFRAPLLRR